MKPIQRLNGAFWFAVHNAIAHPLLLTCCAPAWRFHNWTARRMITPWIGAPTIAYEQEKKPKITVHLCDPKFTCPDGSEHDYSKWENRTDGSGTWVCSKCGHSAIDHAYWM